MVRRVLWDNKFPETSLGTRAGTRVAAAPGPASSAAGLLGESQVNSSLPRQTGFEQHQINLDASGCLGESG